MVSFTTCMFNVSTKMLSFVQKWVIDDFIKTDDFITKEKENIQNKHEGERCIFHPPTVIIYCFFLNGG